MQSAYLQLKEKSAKNKNIFKPEFFRLEDASDKSKFEELLATGVFLYDEIYDQLKELLKSRNPSRAARLTAEDYRQMIKEHLNGREMDLYGVWVYYPWSKRIVHILDEEEFVELRTSANKHKITTAERDILAKKKVGVIGLSVGQSVSVTMAMERSCGELRLADFDTLELNNLNRIRTGVHNLGILKAYSVAREIAELDPFFKVVCYTDGITDENIDDFFLKGGKLDAVIDECDGVNIKILCRIKAKELHVPVLMEASDKGTLDIERFDLEPDRPIMHGWLQHLNIDLEVLKNLKTNAEKLPYILPIAGLETLSPRMKASMIEMQVTLTTWPQLATAVTLGGAVTADTCRRIFLNQYTGSGRYFIDMETLVPDMREPARYEPEATVALNKGEMEKCAAEARQTLPEVSFSPGMEEIREFVSAAILAPSAGNAQPWKWYYDGSYLYLFCHDSGIDSFSDFGHIATHIAHGAALLNLQVKAAKLGRPTNMYLFPLGSSSELTAAVGFGNTIANDDSGDELANYIGTRSSSRVLGSGKKIDQRDLSLLENAVRALSGAGLIIKEGDDALAQLANIAGPAERLRLLNPASHHEFYNKEMRWEHDGEVTDGIHIKSLAISHPEEIALKMVKDPRAAKLLADWEGGQALEFTLRMKIASASACGLIHVPASGLNSHIARVLGGQAMERMWLTATKHNISIHPMMTPLSFFARLHNDGAQLSENVKKEFENIYKSFRTLFPIEDSREGIFLFTLTDAASPTVRSARKPIDEVFWYSK